MNPQDNKMETITLIELFQPQLLAEAEAERINAEQASLNVKPERAAERQKMYDQHNKLGGEIRAMANSLRHLQECIQFKNQRRLDASLEETQLAQTRALVTQMEAELKELSDKFRPHDDMTDKLFIQAIAALSNASEAEKTVRARIGKAIAAHEAHQSNPAFGVGPIPKFKTLREAVRHFYKIGFKLTSKGEAHQAYIGDQIRPYLQNGVIEGIMPESLSWLGRFGPFKTLPCPHWRTHIIDAQLTSEFEFQSQFGPRPNHLTSGQGSVQILCYVEDAGKILANKAGRGIKMPGNSGTDDFFGLFASWEEALTPAVKELTSQGTLDLASKGARPMLGEIIREAWKIATTAVSTKKIFHEGQGRLAEAKINDLVGAYWTAFIKSPWEPSIEGAYALLKHRCARGEIPNVYSFDVQGHFGFRVRTPDHDWIIGEIYCPPEHFNPDESPDPAKLINLEASDNDWFAELGPVRFRINKATSRT